MKIFVLATVALAYAKHEEYIGWKSYYVGLVTEDHSKAFGSMVDRYELDILSHPILGREGVLLVKPEHQAGFEQDAEAEGIAYRIHVNDVKRQLDYDDLLLEKHRRDLMTGSTYQYLPYDNYQELEVIDSYLEYIASFYPDVATVVNAAYSFEGRPIKFIMISTTSFRDQSKPIIFIEGGAHAREWISPPTVTWAIHKLVENVTEHDLLSRFDWILLPVANPDGYKFSFTTSRFWRKTRSTDQHRISKTCPGVDVNRNFDFFWNTVGAGDPCSETYAGSQPFSEIESRVIAYILKKYVHRMALYLSMHSYGSMILYPWGHNGSIPANLFSFHIVAVTMAYKIAQHSLSNFPKYVVGNSARLLNYQVSGASEDYAHELGVPLSYTYELPGLLNYSDGFHLKPKYIKQVCRETWEAIAVGARRAGNMFKKKRL